MNVTLTNSISAGTQTVSYCSFDRPNEISDNGYTADFTYNGNYDRVKMQVLHNSSATLTRYYLGGCYELDVKPSGTTERLYLNGGYYDAPTVLIKQGSTSSVYHILRDHLGSVTHVLNSSGTVIQELSYDAWGRLRNPSTFALYTPTNEPEPYLGRGYCGHEHLTGLGLINMNARLYDPLLGRFLSPDPFVQAPDMTQNFNRYSYCMNNPLKYTDRSGEWFGIDDLFISTVGFVCGYLSNAISTGNWGWSSVKSGLMSAGTAWLGYNTAGLATGVINGTTLLQAGKIAANTIVNSVVPSFNLPITNNFGISLSPAFGFGDGGLDFGANLSAFFSNGDFVIGGSLGVSNHYWGWSASANISGVSAGYGLTYYNDRALYSQTVGSISLGYKDVSFRLSNDLFRFKKGLDRWRTSAAELSIGDFSIGTYVTTNWGKEESDNSVNFETESPLLGINKKMGAWNNGKVFSAPLWIGYKHNKQITRIGYSSKYVQALTQNFVHHYVKPTPDFTDYQNMYVGFYSFFGYDNPISLWNY